MSFVLLTLAIAILAFVAQLALPWWAIVLAAALGGAFLGKGGWQAFGAGFLGLFALWGVQAFLISSANEGVLAARMGILLGGVPGGLMPWLSGLLGGLLGGLGALCGFQARHLGKNQ